MWSAGAASVISLFAICFERYFAKVHPYSLNLKLTAKKVKIIVCLCWFFTTVSNMPTILFNFYNEESKMCIERWPKYPPWLNKAFSMYLFAVFGFLSVTTMIVLYGIVIHKLWFKLSPDAIEGTQIALLRSRKRVTKMVIIVSIIYGLTWLPDLIYYLLIHYHPEYNYGDVVHIIGYVLVICNSAPINPFVYTLQSEKFRHHMLEIISCRRCRNNN